MKLCPKCNSPRVAFFRLDEDWGTGGDWSQVNEDSMYEKSDLEDFKYNNRKDVKCFCCYVCQECF